MQTKPSDIFLTGLEEKLLADTEDGTILFGTHTEFSHERKEVVDREVLVGVVDGNTLTEPRGQITRVPEDSDHEQVHTQLTLKPSGANKVEMKEVMPRRSVPQESLGAVNDIESFD